MSECSGLKQTFLAMRPALTRMLSARGAATEEAEDLIHDLYLRIETQPIGPVAEPRAYLYRMADNLLLDRRRSAMRRTRREEAWAGAADGMVPEHDDQPSAERMLIGREQLALVSAALAALPERTVESFRRFRVDGEPQKIIARDLGISISAVEKHLQRAYRAVANVRISLDAELAMSRRPRTNGEADDH